MLKHVQVEETRKGIPGKSKNMRKDLESRMKNCKLVRVGDGEV